MKYAVFIALLFATRLASSQNTKLTLASDVWPPFTDVPGKHAFAIDLVREALARVKVDVKLEIQDFMNVVEGVKNKKYDGSAALWFNEARAEILLFSEPYLENRLVLVGKRGANVNAKNIAELKGKRIAVVDNYAYGPLLDSTNNITLVKGKSDQENFEHLIKGEADYVLADALLIEYLLKYQHEEASNYLAIGTTALIKRELHFAIRKDVPDAPTIIENFNTEIKKMIKEGTYNKILQLNWVSTDIDGDGFPELVMSGDHAGTSAPLNGYSLKEPPEGTSPNSTTYVIEGSMYTTWDKIPERYKLPPKPVSDSDKIGFGPVIKF